MHCGISLDWDVDLLYPQLSKVLPTNQGRSTVPIYPFFADRQKKNEKLAPFLIHSSVIFYTNPSPIRAMSSTVRNRGQALRYTPLKNTVVSNRTSRHSFDSYIRPLYAS